MRKCILYLYLSLTLVGWCRAQKVWTLEECVRYAIDHNINIQQRAVEIRTKEVRLNTTENSWLPALHANVGEQIHFGNVSASTGTMSATPIDNDLAYTSVSVMASMPLFEGFRIPNQIKADRFSLEAATANLNKAKKDISVQVATVYLQCLYYKGMAKIAVSQVQVSEDLREEAQAMVDEGRRPLSELAEAESQVASDKYTLAEALGNVELSLLHLSQLLNQETMKGFDITESLTPVPPSWHSSEEMYDAIVESFPSIVAARHQLEVSKYSLKVAQSEYYPKLSLEGAFNTYYLNLFHHTNSGSFGSQLKNNRSEVIGLHLSIPIFNRKATRNSVRMARLGIVNQTLALDNVRLEFRKEIQQAYYNASIARSKQAAAEQAEAASKISYEYGKELYVSGRGTIYDLKQANQKWVKAQQDALQAKYEHIIRKHILYFYQEQADR